MRDWVGIATLAGLVLVGVVVWLAFPYLAAWFSFQDCAASGRVSC